MTRWGSVCFCPAFLFLSISITMTRWGSVCFCPAFLFLSISITMTRWGAKSGFLKVDGTTPGPYVGVPFKQCQNLCVVKVKSNYKRLVVCK
jgi:hypothetical protein